MADEILSGAEGCPCCEESGESTGGTTVIRPHGLLTHPASLAAYRIAASSLNIANTIRESGDLSCVRAVGPEQLQDLFDDSEMRSFLELQVRNPEYQELRERVYERLDLRWDSAPPDLGFA